MKKRAISMLMCSVLLAESGLMAGASAWTASGTRGLRLMEPQEILLAEAGDGDDADDAGSRRSRRRDEGDDEGSSRSRRSRDESDDEGTSRRRRSVDEGSDEGSSVRERRSEVRDQGEDEGSSRRSRRAQRSRSRGGVRRHKVSPGLVIPGAVLMVVGGYLMFDGFRDNPQPSGYSTLTYSYSYSGSYANLYSSGYFYNTGKGGIYPRFTFQPQTSGYSNIGSGYSYSPYSSISEDSSSYWYYYYYNYYVGASVPSRMSLSTRTVSDGTYAANNLIEGTVGVVGFVVGTVLLIAGLAHTEQVMDDAGVQFKLQRNSNDELALMASKSF